MTNQITLDNVEKIYPGSKIAAVKNLSLTVSKGEFFCFVGPSGCGKSTTLKLTAGLENPTKGKVQIQGKISMVFQSGALLPWLNVRQNVEFGMKMEGWEKNRVAENSLKYIDMVGLGKFENKFPRELSGGQRQRVGLARALAVEPDILLLDEPFSALDTLTTEALREDILRIWQDSGKTVVMVSHLLEEAILLADRVGVMKSGEIVNVLEIDMRRPRSVGQEPFNPLLAKIKKSLVA